MTAKHRPERSRRRLGTTLVSIVLVLTLAGCAAEPVPEAEVERARETLLPFQQELLAELMVGLEDGPEHAIAVCRVRAGEIAAELAVGGVEMGRTSHRVRNSANAPRPWMEPLLAEYLDSPEDRTPRAVRLEGGRFGYVAPIHMRAQCMSCHGPAVKESLMEEIRALYPDDQATGFRVDDFRGLFWITMPLSEEGSATTS